MTSKRYALKKLTKRKKYYLIGVLTFFAIALFLGIRATYAYYHDSSSKSILASAVGDFDTGDGDINIVIYRESDDGSYVKSYAVPAVGYVYDSSQTTCTISSCVAGTSGDCYYSYDDTTKTISLTSDQKVTCKFYFNEVSEADINIYILMESDSGEYTYDSKTYTLVNAVPAYGYSYNTYSCGSSENVVSYDSDTKEFTVEAKEKDTCYAYFDSVGDSDITTIVYVQSSSGSTTYKQVESIPSGNTYTLSTSKTSSCVDVDGNTNDAVIDYTSGYINITATEKSTCTVYLDLSE